jgi:cell division protein FtsQ
MSSPEPPDASERQDEAPTAGPQPGTSVREPEGRPVLRVDEARRRKLRPWAFAGAAVVLLVAGGMILAGSPVFRARSIVVDGERHLNERAVLRAAGIGSTTNVLRLDGSVTERRLERVAWVSDAIVTTDLPSSIHITVVERVPVATAITSQGRAVVAADGTVLGPAPIGSALPEILVAGEPQDTSSTPAPVPSQALADAARVSGSLPPGLRSEIEAVWVADPLAEDGSMTLDLRSGVSVSYGPASEIEAKAAALRAILAYAEHQEVEPFSIDVSTPGAPTARFPGSGAAAVVPVDPGDGDHGSRAPSPSPSSSRSAGPSPSPSA